jgi:hypothetical protein
MQPKPANKGEWTEVMLPPLAVQAIVVAELHER